MKTGKELETDVFVILMLVLVFSNSILYNSTILGTQLASMMGSHLGFRNILLQNKLFGNSS